MCVRQCSYDPGSEMSRQWRGGGVMAPYTTSTPESRGCLATHAVWADLRRSRFVAVQGADGVQCSMSLAFQPSWSVYGTGGTVGAAGGVARPI